MMMSSSTDQSEVLRLHKKFKWPHKTSHIFACFSCAVGMYSINRFSYLIYIYKGPFIFQFVVLSLILGIPFFYLIIILGDSMGKTIADIWSISPSFKGIGVTLLYINIIIGTYSTVPISWLFTFFRDSFISSQETYRWTHASSPFLISKCNQSFLDCVSWTIPSYLHENTLQRKIGISGIQFPQFEQGFNLAIVWAVVFLCLCGGVKSYGKVSYLFCIIPTVLLTLLLIRFLQEWTTGINFIFNTSWRASLADSWSWLLAAREVVLIWIIFSSVLLQICNFNKKSTPITRNFFIIIALSMYVLIASSFMFSCAIEALRKYKISYAHSSYENISNIHILEKSSEFMPLIGLFAGDCSASPLNYFKSSGYQSIRLSTELFPAVLSIEGSVNLSPFWAVCFYTMMILFAFGQQISLWWCIVNSVITINNKLLRKWEVLITLGLCAVGYLLSFPMATNVGISAIYFLDCCIGSLWWILFIYFAKLVAILFIEGKPYGMEQLFDSISRNETFGAWIIPSLVFLWNLILPISYMILCIIFLRTSQFEVNFPWTSRVKSWPKWATYLGLCVQIFPVLIIFTICLIRVCRFLFKDYNARDNFQICCFALSSDPQPGNSRHSTPHSIEIDNPPKYTPPPSYSTATSRHIRDVLRRNSIELATINVSPIQLPDLMSYHIQPSP